MLNKIWASLIILSILFAFGQDIHDEVYNNAIPLNIPYTTLENDAAQLVLSFKHHKLMAELKSNQRIIIKLDQHSPQLLLDIAAAHGKEHTLTSQILAINPTNLTLLLPELHWSKLRKITQAAFDMASFAAKLAIGLIGIMALWLGLMQIADKSGLSQILVKIVQPALRWLFPGIPKDHPAFSSISMNMTANILGLGNAATPLGIKAMQQLQTLNKNKDVASNEMCMFLALNTSSVQLLPPVTLIALMGTQISELIVPIILATSCSTITAVIVAKLYAKRQKDSCNN